MIAILQLKAAPYVVQPDALLVALKRLLGILYPYSGVLYRDKKASIADADEYPYRYRAAVPSESML